MYTYYPPITLWSHLCDGIPAKKREGVVPWIRINHHTKTMLDQLSCRLSSSSSVHNALSVWLKLLERHHNRTVYRWWIIQKIHCVNSVQEPLVRFMRLFTSLSLQRDDFVCVVTASKFSTSATVTLLSCRISRYAKSWKDDGALSLSLKMFSVHAWMCMPLLVTAEMAVRPGSLWIKKTVTAVLRMF